MKLARDVSGRQLAQAPARLGYNVDRHTGRHMRLTTQRPTEHHLTIPDTGSVKVGTLSAILREVSAHVGMTREELLRELFQ